MHPRISKGTRIGVLEDEEDEDEEADEEDISCCSDGSVSSDCGSSLGFSTDAGIGGFLSSLDGLDMEPVTGLDDDFVVVVVVDVVEGVLALSGLRDLEGDGDLEREGDRDPAGDALLDLERFFLC
jgi:hypothetical protein